MKKYVTVMFTLMVTVMITMLMGTDIFAKSKDVKYLYVGDLYIVRDGQLGGMPEGMSYDAETNTLTLENFHFLSDYSYGSPIGYSGDKELNIVVKGTNTIEGKLSSTGEVLATGIFFETCKNGSDVTIKKAKITSKTIKKLQAKKKYYVRIRTYINVNGKKKYSNWSKKKSKKTK